MRLFWIKLFDSFVKNILIYYDKIIENIEIMIIYLFLFFLFVDMTVLHYP